MLEPILFYFCLFLPNLRVSKALMQLSLNQFPIFFKILIKELQDLGLDAGLCLNQFLFILFISHKLVSEQGLGASKFE
jgi:hypothetical protein